MTPPPTTPTTPPPPELAELSPERSLAIVALAEGAGRDALAGALVAAVLAAVAWGASGRWLVAAIAFCVAFPLAARAWRGLRLGGRRRRFARMDPAEARRTLAPLVAAAWERASPGRRAALMRITRPPV